MSTEPTHARSLDRAQAITELLARETNTPIDRVAEVYATESAALGRTARIKTFIDVLAIRRARIILSNTA